MLTKYIEDAQQEVEATAHSLICKAESLMRRLQQVVNLLDKKMYKSINPQGEVQGVGADIDRLCTILGEKLLVVSLLESLVSDTDPKKVV